MASKKPTTKTKSSEAVTYFYAAESTRGNMTMKTSGCIEVPVTDPEMRDDDGNELSVGHRAYLRAFIDADQKLHTIKTATVITGLNRL